jgi:drug/metabolite transporter (DMT)-like permease
VTLPYLLVFVAAILYAAGALLVKRSADLGVGVWRTAFVANAMTTLMFQPLWLLGGTFRPELWWQPVLVALCFVTGQGLTFISLERGDVSVATPVLGLKILLVAVLVTVMAGETLRWPLWAAAFLATLGVALLNRRSRDAVHAPVGGTILTAGLAAICYAVFDVLVQQWSPAWGLGRFLPITLLCSSAWSLVFVARFRAPLSAIPRASWGWLLAGTVLIAGQSVMFVTVLAKWGHVAPINVIYSSRGLWTVVLVWLAGHWVHSREQHHGRAVLIGRLAGAACMMLAITLVLW